MRSLLAVFIALAATAAVVLAQQPQRMEVEVLILEENMPAEWKPGKRVNLQVVTSKSIAANGQILVQAKTMVGDVEIASAQELKDSPSYTVKLLATEEQATKIEKLKAMRISVVECTADGKVETKRSPSLSGWNC